MLTPNTSWLRRGSPPFAAAAELGGATVERLLREALCRIKPTAR
jgi:hypothetical protein